MRSDQYLHTTVQTPLLKQSSAVINDNFGGIYDHTPNSDKEPSRAVNECWENISVLFSQPGKNQILFQPGEGNKNSCCSHSILYFSLNSDLIYQAHVLLLYDDVVNAVLLELVQNYTQKG